MDSTDVRRALAVAATLAVAACTSPPPNPNEGPGAVLAASPPVVVAPGATAPAATDPDVAGNRVLYANADFEAPALERDSLEGWQMSQHAGAHSYDFDLDRTIKRRGRQSLRVTNVGPEPYGAVFQVIPADDLRGRTVEFSGWLRTAQATGGGAQLTLIMRTGGAIVAHKFLNNPGVTGTREWQRYVVRLAVPKSAARVEFGAMLVGPGTLWLDDTTLTLVN